MESKYFVFGDSGHAKVVLDILLANDVSVAGIVDDQPKGKDLFNIPIIAFNDFIIDKNASFIVAIGNNGIRKKVVAKLNSSFYLSVHPSASVSKFAKLGAGTVVMPKAVINAGAVIGEHCILNSGSIVEHDCNLEDFVHISPNVALGGNVTVGEGTHIGIGACVIQGIKIGKWTTIGAGTVVINDVPDFGVVVGNPGKIIKYNHSK